VTALTLKTVTTPNISDSTDTEDCNNAEHVQQCVSVCEHTDTEDCNNAEHVQQCVSVCV